jgi:hypothetical protein
MMPQNQQNRQMQKQQDRTSKKRILAMKSKSMRSDVVGTAPKALNENESVGPLLDDTWKPYNTVGGGSIEVGFLLPICIWKDPKTIRISEDPHSGAWPTDILIRSES